jgi:hypothetical protein
MFRDPISLLEYEAKRRPDLAHLVATLDSLTEEQIAAARVPLPWMRQALLAMKRQRQTADLESEVGACTVMDRVPDPVGEMRQWDGPDGFVRIGRTQLQMQRGQLLWVDATGVWIDTIHTTLIDPQIMRCTTGCGQVTRSEYIQAVRQRLQKLVPTAVAEPAQQFRIYRPATG